MNTKASSLSDLTDQMVALAERYAQDALMFVPQGCLGIGTDEPEEAREQMRLRLRTQFLFPQFSGRSLGLMAALYWQRQALTRLVNVPQQNVPAPLQAQTERLTSQLEQCFMDLVSQTKVLVGYRALSRVQNFIFEREYVRIPFQDLPG